MTAQAVGFWAAALLLYSAAILLMNLIDARWYGYVSCTAALCITGAAQACYSGFRPYALWVFLLLAAGCAVLSRPSLRVSFWGTLAREIIRLLVRRSGRDMHHDTPAAAKSETSQPPPRPYGTESVDLDGLAVEVLHHPDSAPGKVLLQCHGGGYAARLGNAHRKNAQYYSKHCKNVAVVSFDYRVAPQHVYPAALEDAVKVWDWLAQQGVRAADIAVAGDSAGGNLALALTLWLRDHGRPLPCAVFCMSPLTDFSRSGASYGYNLYHDPMFGKDAAYLPTGPVSPPQPLAYAGAGELRKPYLSPLFADYSGFPPLMLQTGTWEVLLSDSVDLHEKAKAQGAAVSLALYDGMFHAFQFGRGALRESRAAWRQAGGFLCQHLYPAE